MTDKLSAEELAEIAEHHDRIHSVKLADEINPCVENRLLAHIAALESDLAALYEALDKEGLPREAGVRGLIKHHRGNAHFAGDLEGYADRLEMEAELATSEAALKLAETERDFWKTKAESREGVDA